MPPPVYNLSAIAFEPLSADDVRLLSVKRINIATTFDSLLHPVPGGLYDLALGAFADNRCSTCQLGKPACPGHCGHIELPVPVYHPLYMEQCLRLLRSKCSYCHRLRMSRAEVHRYLCKFRLIAAGLLKSAEEVDDIRPSNHSSTKTSEPNDSSDSESDDRSLIAIRNEFFRRALRNSVEATPSAATMTKKLNVEMAYKSVMKVFLADMTRGQKCSNCGGISPTYRRDRFVKIFRVGLTEKHKAAMIQQGMVARNSLIEQLQDRRNRKRKREDTNLDEGVVDVQSDLPPSDPEEFDEEDVDDAIAGDSMLMSEATDSRIERSKKSTTARDEYITPSEVHASLSQLLNEDREILNALYGLGHGKDQRAAQIEADNFFAFNLLVPPSRYRPESISHSDEIQEASGHMHYKQILIACDNLMSTMKVLQNTPSESSQQSGVSNFQAAWIQLQDAVNSLVDRDKGSAQSVAAKASQEGVRQKLEKKEGLFRQNMMGKRVNFAARTVISPDPNIESNEIGVPPMVAKNLSYPEPVTSHNFYALKSAVINGPEIWPGAVAIENENGQVINLKRKNLEERQALANQLLAFSSVRMNGTGSKKVHRHLKNGDLVLMNRQPTLHKPSIMAHSVRVLPGERTFRLHYANCSSYNADFDGDEMNLHFPQNELARAEAATIADADHQYLSSTGGEPLRGLIQDHISIAVWLTSKDTFLDKEEYQQLVYSCLRPEDSHTIYDRLLTIPPVIFRPKRLWTGKQMITTILLNIQPPSYPGITLCSMSQTPKDYWGLASEEQAVLVQNGEFLCGILDKKQIGSKGQGFINAVYESYGHKVTSKVIGVLGRMLTKFLHMRAFSCGIDDLLLTETGEKNRSRELDAAHNVGSTVASNYVLLDDRSSSESDLQYCMEEVLRDESKRFGLDRAMNAATSLISSSATKQVLPDGLSKPFPMNQMQTMTASGAKGSQVNANLISCNLGQQVLEGRRVPVMISGKTLPCFSPFDPNVRAGGYVVDRFLTGIRPQEYYFHSMAGREGLIDTAVKTSSSGYLQRCLIKGMEGLKVEYDTSVRDYDGALVQFLYGEDGLDVTKQKYFRNFRFLAENFLSLFRSLGIRDEFQKIQNDAASAWNKSALKKVRSTGNIAAKDPAISVFAPSRWAGSTSERFYEATKQYCDTNPDKLLKSKKDGIKGIVGKKDFLATLDVKYLKSVVEPGEAVGIIAGQSVGEPSTQMTLNTFHLAGHSSKNVTLGIPRLRELVMTATANIATPVMSLRFQSHITPTAGELFVKTLNRLSVADVTKIVKVEETVKAEVAYTTARVYQATINFFPPEEYCAEHNISVDDVIQTMKTKFVFRLQSIVKAELKKKERERVLRENSKTDAQPTIGTVVATVEAASDLAQPTTDDDVGDVEEDGADARRKKNDDESVTYDEPDDDEMEKLAEQNIMEADPDDSVNDTTYGGSPGPNADQDKVIDQDQQGNYDVAPDLESTVKRAFNAISSFSLDHEGRSCEFVIEYDASTPRILVLPCIEQCLKQTIIRATKGVKTSALTTEDEKNAESGEMEKVQSIATEGVNLVAMYEHQDIIDINRLRTNDVVAILKHYGVEACRAAIVRETKSLFDNHAIDVDFRHLGLIADYMTRNGGYAPFSRSGLQEKNSPLMKMSFETTVAFLKDAVMGHDFDDLQSPSARLIAGKLGNIGTGSFDVLVPVV